MERTDEQLLEATRGGEAEAFGAFFVRHRALVLAYLTRRCGADTAADLLAETFAAALLAVHGGRAPAGPTAAPWLLTIARNKLHDLHRRGRVEDAARRRIALERIAPGDEDLRRIETIGADVDAALAVLPAEQRDAVRARILDERDYDEIAREQDASESAIRQRVSRALRRPQTEADRGAAALAALKLVNGTSIEGIRTDSIRVLAAGGPDRGIVLIPAKRLQAAKAPPLPADTPKEVRERFERPPVDDPLCIWQLDSVDGAGAACYSLDDIRAGRAWSMLGHRAMRLVTDEVARIRVDFADAPSLDVEVHDNIALYDQPRGRLGEETTTFLDKHGTPVLVIEPPKPSPDEAFIGATGPVPPGSTHGGAVKRIAIKGSGLDARHQLVVRLPKRKPPAFVILVLERPACAGKRHVTELIGALTGRTGRFEVHPSSGDRTRARWCPGTYRGGYRYKGEKRLFGTFSFRVR